jgi:hypothetical protein
MSNRRKLKHKSPNKKIPVIMLARTGIKDAPMRVVCTCGVQSEPSDTSSPLMMWAQEHRDETGHQLREH